LYFVSVNFRNCGYTVTKLSGDNVRFLFYFIGRID
jgi:hypothetical protein